MEQNSIQPSAPESLKKPNNGSVQLLLAFIAGMLFAALLFGIFTYVNKAGDIKDAYRNPASESTTRKAPETEGKEAISEEELARYVSAKDCTTAAEYSTLALGLSRTKMKSIDLDKSLLVVGDESLTQYARWKNELPKLVDSDCKLLKLTEVRAGDLLNLYSLRSEANGIPEDLQLIQKLN